VTDADTTPLDWNTIDPLIFDGSPAHAMMEVRKATGCGLSKAIDLVSDRYRFLRERHPEKFKVSHEQYWEGFYS